MAILAYALPVVPGREDEAAGFGEQVKEHQDRYDELNRLTTVKRHMEWTQRGPTGTNLIVVFEVDDLTAINREFGDDAYDRWWTERVERLHGFNPRESQPEWPVLVYAWTSEDGA
jgi:hypothetical protein